MEDLTEEEPEAGSANFDLPQFKMIGLVSLNGSRLKREAFVIIWKPKMMSFFSQSNPGITASLNWRMIQLSLFLYTKRWSSSQVATNARILVVAESAIEPAVDYAVVSRNYSEGSILNSL